MSNVTPIDAEYTGRRWRYGLIYRPAGYATVPEGRIVGADRPHPRFAHGTVDYPERLPLADVAAYQLVCLGEVIEPGQRVRSFDFPDRDRSLEGDEACYVEGVVLAITGPIEGCPRYRIRVERDVWCGRETGDRVGAEVLPPVNGTSKAGGGMCAAVERIDDPTDAHAYKGYKPDYLRLIFGTLCPPDDWRGPIDAEVLPEAVAAAEAAIEFMTATTPEVTRLPSGLFRLTSVGYRAGPAGP